MATLNYAFKELSCKIVYYGCGLCGKTTNLEHIHKTVPGKFRGELVSLATEQDRTLFFDFLPLDLGEVKGFKTKFQLYTVPGQVYYNATRKLVLRGVDGICFVVDSSRDRIQENLDSLENLKQNLADYGYHLQNGDDDHDGVPWVIQYNKRDLPDVATLEELEKAINFGKAPYLEAVAYKGNGVKETLKGISTLVIKKLNKDSTGGDVSLPKAAPKSASAAAAAKAEDDDEYGELGAEDDSKSAKAAAPKPVEKVAVKKVEEKKAAAPSPKADLPGGDAPTLNISQACDARWRGLKTGEANLTLANVSGGARDEYQLNGLVSFLGIFKRTISTKLKYKLSDPKTHEGQETKAYTFEVLSGPDGPSGLSVVVIEAPQKQLFVSYIGSGGEVKISPEGKAALD
jgi:signal recognition particle receptor subunit beta